MSFWMTDNSVEFFNTEITWETIQNLRSGSIVKANAVDSNFLAQSIPYNFKANSVGCNFASTRLLFNFKANKG